MPDITSPLSMIDDIIRRNRGRKRMILIEMKKNLETIGLLDEGVSIDNVILNLEAGQLEKAFDSGFDFNSFRLLKPRVNADIAGNNAFYQRYVGWTFDRLFENILIKFSTLQKIARMGSDAGNVNKTARLNNILRLITLLLLHIDKKT
jgi:hypothetical protein